MLRLVISGNSIPLQYSGTLDPEKTDIAQNENCTATIVAAIDGVFGTIRYFLDLVIIM